MCTIIRRVAVETWVLCTPSGRIILLLLLLLILYCISLRFMFVDKPCAYITQRVLYEVIRRPCSPPYNRSDFEFILNSDVWRFKAHWKTVFSHYRILLGVQLYCHCAAFQRPAAIIGNFCFFFSNKNLRFAEILYSVDGFFFSNHYTPDLNFERVVSRLMFTPMGWVIIIFVLKNGFTKI